MIVLLLSKRIYYYSINCKVKSHQNYNSNQLSHFIIYVITELLNCFSLLQQSIISTMISYLFLSLPSTTTYDSLKKKLQFHEDHLGVSNWVMKFPFIIYSANLKQKHIFRQDAVYVQPCQQSNLQSKWKYFVMTNSLGNKHYCTSQIFYEKTTLLSRSSNMLSQVYRQYYVPKCLILISEKPYFKLHVNLLKIYRELRKKAPSISSCVKEDLYKLYQHLIQDNRQSQWEGINLENVLFDKNRKIQVPIQKTFEYYIQCCNRHQIGQALYLEKSTNRQVLHLYQLSNSLYQYSYYFHLPIKANTLRIALSAILLQKQIIFVSANSNLNVMLIQTLMQMILPFKWQYMYIPNLSEDMLEVAEECFMPYIVGLQRKYIDKINCDQRVIIDVDSDTYAINTKLNLLPKCYQKYFSRSMVDKNYLEFQKEVRISSLNFIVDILSQGCYGDQLLNLSKQQKDYYLSKCRQRAFYEQFIKDTMMFLKFTENKSDVLYRQLVYLLILQPEQRKNLLSYKFNLIQQHALTPIRYDNEKSWIRFYNKIVMQNRRFFQQPLTKKSTILQTSNIFNGNGSASSQRLSHTFSNADNRQLYKSSFVQQNNYTQSTVSTEISSRTFFNRSTIQL